jgi:hypothetical protein
MTNRNDAQTNAPASPEVEFDEQGSGFGNLDDAVKPTVETRNPPAAQFAGNARSESLDTSDGISFDDYGLKDPFSEANMAGDLNYLQPKTLEAPPPRPGFVQRFVRFSEGGKTDEKNVAAKTQKQGWRPRKFQRIDAQGYAFSKVRGGEDYVIMINGHVLCERPAAVNDRFKEMYQQANHRMTDAERNQYKQQGEEAGGDTNVEFKNISQARTGYRPLPPVAPNRNKT